MERDALARCHPAVAFAYFAAAIVLTAVVQHPAYLAAGLLAGAVYCLLLKGRAAVPLLMGLLPVFALVAAINPLFNTRGSHVLFEVMGRPYTFEALAHGMAVAAMLVGMLVWFACYSQVITGDKVACLFGNVAPALSVLVTMVLRMVPGLARKASQVETARRCVGKGAVQGDGLRAKVAAGAGVLSALVDHALEGSVTTADSMRARGYGTGRRTTYQLWRWDTRDVGLLALEGTLLAAVLFAGIPAVQYTPTLMVGALNWGFVAYCAFLTLPVALRVKEEVAWRTSLLNI